MTGRVPSMTPNEFAFTLTVPREAGFVPIVRGVAAHVVTYSAMDATNGKAFVDSVVAAGERAFARGRHGTPCHVQFTCEHGEVHVTLDGETIRQRVAS
jgi:hypothetical protein